MYATQGLQKLAGLEFPSQKVQINNTHLLDFCFTS